MKICLYGSPVLGFRNKLTSQLPQNFQITSLDYDASDSEKKRILSETQVIVGVRYDDTIKEYSEPLLFQVPGIGYDEVNFSIIPNKTTVCNVGAHEYAVSEFVILGMLQSYQHFMEANQDFKRGSWARSSRFEAKPHRELFGSTAAILGYGRIGKEIARKLKTFGVTTYICNRTQVKPDGFFKKQFHIEQLNEMAAISDFLIISIALTNQTRSIVDTKTLKNLGFSGVLINISRGPVIDEKSLYLAVKNKIIATAIIDVWYNYPKNKQDIHARPSQYDFTPFNNILMTPHLSGWSEGTIERRWSFISENILRLFRGEKLENVVRLCIT